MMIGCKEMAFNDVEGKHTYFGRSIFELFKNFKESRDLGHDTMYQGYQKYIIFGFRDLETDEYFSVGKIAIQKTLEKEIEESDWESIGMRKEDVMKILKWEEDRMEFFNHPPRPEDVKLAKKIREEMEKRWRENLKKVTSL